MAHHIMTQIKTRGPWALALCLRTNLLLAKVPEVAHIPSFYPRGVKLSLFLLYEQQFPRYGPFFLTCHIWAWNLASGQSSRSCTRYLLSTPRGSKLRLFVLNGQQFPRYEAIFKIAIFGHETWQVAKVPEVAHIPSFYPQGVEIEVICAQRAAVSEIRGNLQNCHIWAWNFASGQNPELAHIPSFYPRGSKLSLFLLYGQRFPRYGQFFYIAIFGHETWQLAKYQKLHIYPLSTPGGRTCPFFWSTGSGFRDTGQFSKLPYLGMKLGKWPKPRTCTKTLFLPHGGRN